MVCGRTAGRWRHQYRPYRYGSAGRGTGELYARRKEWPLEAMEVHIELERFNGSEYPGYTGESQYVHQVREKVVLHGDQLTDDQRARLMEITTKCPVRRVLTTPTFFVSADEPIKEA